MNQVIVSIVAGLSIGGTLTLVAIGIVLAYRATGVFNFAHGQFMLLPAFVAGAWQGQHSAPTLVVIVAATLIAALVSGAFYLLILRRMTGMPLLLCVVATLGLASILDGVVSLAFPATQYTFKLSVLPTGTTHVFGTRVAESSLALTGFTLALALLVVGVLRFTRLGRSIRAAGQDPILASQSGMNVRMLHLGSWMIAGALAGIAGIAYGSAHIVDSNIVYLALAAFPAILIGGLDSIPGAVVGGLAVGVFQGFVNSYASPTMSDVYTYSLLLIVMLVRPQGVFGTTRVVRV